jgi:uncharacterized integral membrane protein
VAQDFEREPVAGVDPTLPAPGVGPGTEDPAVAAVTSGTDDESPAKPTPKSSAPARLWASLVLATVLLALLIIFIAENSRSVTISFLGAHGHISLALALLIAAVVGVAVTLLAGTARILQLRREVRRSKRAGRDRGQRLQPR